MGALVLSGSDAEAATEEAPWSRRLLASRRQIQKPQSYI